MINGFILEIDNLTSEELSVPLFTDYDCPPGLVVHTKGNVYDYNALLLMAKTKGFRGKGIFSSFPTKIWMNNGQRMFIIDPGHNLSELKFIIEGPSAFLNLIVPPIEKGIFQLIQQY